MPDLKQRLEKAFAENFEKGGELGAAVAIWQDGRPVIEKAGGFTTAQRTIKWTNDTLVLVWSATKGIGSACLLHALQEDGITLDRTVAGLWPEFRQNGKSDISIACLLSHAAGLPALDRKVDILDYEAVIEALEEQAPLWRPGSAHGYHARTFGFLIDELTRRVSGLRIAEYWRKHLADPLGLDFWIGLPNDLNARVATMYAARAGGKPEPAAFYRDMMTPGTLPQRTFTSPSGLHSVSSMNKPEIRAQPIVSLNGIGSARALAKFYSILAGHSGANGRQHFKTQTMEWMRKTLFDGVDRVL
jgi:CubicO group peptidase (beta-lactamase class C family)